MASLPTDSWYQAALRELGGFESYRLASAGHPHWFRGFCGVRLIEVLSWLERRLRFVARS